MIQPHQTPEDLAASIQELLNDRKAEKILEEQGMELLRRLGIKSNAIVMALGLEQ